MNYQQLSQQEINKVFLKACKLDDIDLVKYLLTNNQLLYKAQLNISKQSGVTNDKKDNFLPLIIAVQYNAKKVYKYFIEQCQWFSIINKNAKIQILCKATMKNDVETIDYLFKYFEKSSKLIDYEKPYILTQILISVINNNSDKIFDYLMNLSNSYKEHINNKSDIILREASKSNPKMLKYMLQHVHYKPLNVELYLACLEHTKNNGESALILFEYGLKNNLFDVGLTNKYSSYMIKKVHNNIFQCHHDTLIKHLHEEHQKEDKMQELIVLVNKNIKDYFYNEHQCYKNGRKIAPVLEYAIKHRLLTKETRENIIHDIIEHDYKNLLTIISQYSYYGENINVDKAFDQLIAKKSLSQDKFLSIEQLIDLDIEKNINITKNNCSFFSDMEKNKIFNHNYINIIKKVLIKYDFEPDIILENIYEQNEEITKILKMKKLNNILVMKSNEMAIEKKRIIKI